MRVVKVLVLLLALCLVLACGGAGGGSLAQPPTVSISPDDSGQNGLSVAPSGTIQFTATAPSAVIWSTSRGTIDANGLFTAPATFGDCAITCSLASDPTVKDQVNLSVQVSRTLRFTLKNTSNVNAIMKIGPAPAVNLAPGGSTITDVDLIFNQELPTVYDALARDPNNPPTFQYPRSYTFTPSDARDPLFTGLTATFSGPTGSALVITKD